MNMGMVKNYIQWISHIISPWSRKHAFCSLYKIEIIPTVQNTTDWNTNVQRTHHWHWNRYRTEITRGSYFQNVTHYSDVMTDAMASQITSLPIVNSTVYSGADKGKTSKLRVTGLLRGIHRWPVSSPHKCPVTRKMLRHHEMYLLRHVYWGWHK